MIEKMVELESNDIVKNNIEKLKQLFPDIVRDGKIDMDTLKLLLGEDIEKDKEGYKFEWSGKTDCYKTIQSPSLGTLKPQKKESIDFDNSENIIIEGDNLEVLKLLQTNYSNKIKLIYIDPPYNTGNDFIYSDNFTTPLDNYFELTGQIENGETTQSNKSKDGRKHTQWLNMIFPRLLLSRTLLREDGFIFISIDDNEVDNLKRLCNEVYGEENFLGQIVRGTGTPTGLGTDRISNEIDYILVYRKSSLGVLNGLPLSLEDKEIYNETEENGDKYLLRPLRKTGGEDRREDRPSMYFSVTDPDGNEVFPISPLGYESRWRCGEKTYIENTKNGLIEWKKNKNNEWIPYQKFYLKGRLKQSTNLWSNIEGNKKGTRDLTKVFNSKVFDFPKPLEVIKKILKIGSNSEDIILDFFGGSGTTGHSVLELNKEDKGSRKFILVQLPEKTKNPDFPTICDITKERIRRVIKGYGDNPKPLNDGFKVFKLDKSNYVINKKLSIKPNITNTDRENLITQLRKQFESSTIHDECLIKNYKQLDVIYEVILKEGYSLNSKIEEIKILDTNLYKVTDNNKKCYITFDDIDTSIIKDKEFKGISKDTLFVCLDKGLTDSDKSNLSLTFQLKTI